MSHFVIFDLFHTLVHGADHERDQVVREMAGIVGVPPRALVQAYHDTWRQRLTRWNAGQTVRILAERLGGSRPTRRWRGPTIGSLADLPGLLADLPRPSSEDDVRTSGRGDAGTPRMAR